VAVIEQFGVGAPDLADVRHRARRFGFPRVLIVVALVAAMIAAGVWWARGGTFLHAAGGGYGGVVLPGQQFSVGVDLTTVSGPSVVLDDVSSANPDGARVRYSIYRNAPGALGFGAVHGRLGPDFPTTPLHGDRVSQPAEQPERGATWLVVTMTGSHPGVYRLSNITIKYHSGRRTRRSSAGTSVCVLVAPPADQKRLLRQVENFTPDLTDLNSVDPLVAQFETCSGPTLNG
jgi:hypothetical protein